MEIGRRDFIKIAPAAAVGGALGFIFGQTGRIRIDVVNSSVPQPSDLLPLGIQSAGSLPEFLIVFDRAFNWLSKAGLAARLPNRPENYFIDVLSINTSIYQPILSAVHMQRGRHLDGAVLRSVDIRVGDKENFSEQIIGNDLTSMREIPSTRWREVAELLNGHFEIFAEQHNNSLAVRREYEQQIKDKSRRMPTLNT